MSEPNSQHTSARGGSRGPAGLRRTRREGDPLVESRFSEQIPDVHGVSGSGTSVKWSPQVQNWVQPMMGNGETRRNSVRGAG